MLKKREPKDIDPLLISGVNSVRKMLMNKGYFVKDVLEIDESTVDIIAIKESLMNSERLRVRLVVTEKQSGLSIPAIRQFYSEQARIFGLKGLLISLSPISMQAQKYIERNQLDVKDINWLKKNADY